ncbi:hypothetical protein BpHYR1_046723 [Brachionus plicatilis]|uniref:Uncharacterized protein n=1 Tax=Brachionus plicatilis TaxID=10195 RepID=A0A3M7SEB6_BRAPC|nr:hypothetical protein BpHYR1_046723 [Brachionus plicatilis]
MWAIPLGSELFHKLLLIFNIKLIIEMIKKIIQLNIKKIAYSLKFYSELNSVNLIEPMPKMVYVLIGLHGMGLSINLES